MPDTWSVERRADRTVVVFDGEVDFANAPALETDLRAQLQPEGLLVLDLRGLRFIDSSGLRVFLRLWKSSQETSSRVVMVKGSAGVQRLLGFVREEAPFELVESPEMLDEPDA
ncbi:MAG TPA: STAS domain-containing protein [Actinomycetota bacterium]|nr:STAS domain-containing protein [Actinomycetota bacterium]